MSNATGRKKSDKDILIGSTVLGERGQLVIPKAIRDKMKLKSGTRLLVMLHDKGIGILPAEQMHKMVQEMTDQLSKFSNE